MLTAVDTNVLLDVFGATQLWPGFISRIEPRITGRQRRSLRSSMG